jgi:hypothetical protein
VTGGDTGPKLVMKGSPVRVRASAFRDLQEFLLRVRSPFELVAGTKRVREPRAVSRARLISSSAERVSVPSSSSKRRAYVERVIVGE